MKTMFAAIGLMLASATAQAHPRDYDEHLRERRQDRREIADDRHDLQSLENLLTRFDSARWRRDRFALRGIDTELSALLANELVESRVELAQDRAEAWRDRGNRDDRRDARQEAFALERRRAIAGELRAMTGQIYRGSLDRKRYLITELIGIARQEIADDHQELREDRREARQDWRRGW